MTLRARQPKGGHNLTSFIFRRTIKLLLYNLAIKNTAR